MVARSRIGGAFALLLLWMAQNAPVILGSAYQPTGNSNAR
jgi:hypothetical protein